MSDQTTPRTYRDALLPIVGADALHEAEARVYTGFALGAGQHRYQCKDGRCALGVMVRVLEQSGKLNTDALVCKPDFPDPLDLGVVLRRDDSTYLLFDALRIIAGENDRGNLATPGSLTALLDSEVA